MTVTLEELKAAPVGSRLIDEDGDLWKKNENDKWDWFLPNGEINSSYSCWSNDSVSSLAIGQTSKLIPGVPQDEAVISKKDLLKWLGDRYYHGDGATSLQQDLIEHFGLVIQQDLVITLRIPVTNMDPMGDTYQMGRERINSMNIYGVVDAIDTVEITERKVR